MLKRHIDLYGRLYATGGESMPKTARIYLRQGAGHKQPLIQAAALQGISLSNFTISAALDKARVVAGHQPPLLKPEGLRPRRRYSSKMITKPLMGWEQVDLTQKGCWRHILLVSSLVN